MTERLGKISSNVKEMLIKMLSNIKKASVEFSISEDGFSIYLLFKAFGRKK